MTWRAWPRILVLAIIAAPSAAHAGNDDELIVGNHAAMLGGAVIASVNDASASWYNPAGLGAVDRDQFDVSATVYTLRLYSAPKLVSTMSGASSDGSVVELLVAPAQIAYVRRLASGTSLGFGYFVPKASNFVLRDNLTVRNGTPPSQWQLSAAGAETQHTGVLALGTSISDRLRLGASVIGGYATSVASASLFGAVSSSDRTLGSSAVTSIATASRFSLQIALGMQWQLSSAWTVGISVRTPELQLHSSGNNDYNLSVSSLLDITNPRLRATAHEDTAAQGFELVKAGRGALSVSLCYGSGWLTAEIDLQPGLSRPRADVDRKAVWNARLGFYRALSRVLSFGLGLFTDRSPDAKAYSLLQGSGDFFGATAGVGLSNEHLLAASERASSLTFKRVFALRYAFANGPFGRIVGNPSRIEDAPFLIERGSIVIHELALYVGGGLQF